MCAYILASSGHTRLNDKSQRIVWLSDRLIVWLYTSGQARSFRRSARYLVLHVCRLLIMVVFMYPTDFKSLVVESYMTRILPTGETCAKADKRLKMAGLRPLWEIRSRELRSFLRSSDEIPDYLDERGRTLWVLSEAAYRAFLTFDANTPPLSAFDDLPPSDAAFVLACREGLLMGKPEIAAIDQEVRWVGAYINLDRPPIEKAPSMATLNLAIKVRTSEKWSDNFWTEYLRKRMSPGDTTARSKKKAFKEDEVDAAAQDQSSHQRELMEKLFGDEV